MMYDWMEECWEYNHHEMFHIAQDSLKKEDVSNALEEIMGPNGWAMDGGLDEKGAWFSTAKEDIEFLACELSKKFPEATVFGQDCWDYEGYIVCFENGQPSTNYNAEYAIFEESLDDPDFYEVELDVITKNGYWFEAGGGMVYKDNIKMMNQFITEGTGDYSKDDAERDDI